MAAISTTFYPQKWREFLIPPPFIHLSHQLSVRGVVAIYNGNEPSAMRLIYSLVFGAD